MHNTNLKNNNYIHVSAILWIFTYPHVHLSECNEKKQWLLTNEMWDVQSKTKHEINEIKGITCLCIGTAYKLWKSGKNDGTFLTGGWS